MDSPIRPVFSALKIQDERCDPKLTLTDSAVIVRPRSVGRLRTGEQVMIIYLCGGMRSGWQDKVMDATASMECDVFHLDPRRNDTKEFDEYTALDLYHVRQCDVVFAYLEADNPSGAGLCCEVSYAKGLGKTVILVNEKDDRYLKFVESLADAVFTNLADGIAFLQKMQI
ncbi:MAG: hypothetical protein V1738_02325 [Patescibacteria group bacterium]